MITEWGPALMGAGAVVSAGAGAVILSRMGQSAQRIRRRVTHERVRLAPGEGRRLAERALAYATTLGGASALYFFTYSLTGKEALSLTVALGGFALPGWLREWRETRRLGLLGDQLGRAMGMVSTSLRRGTPLEGAIANAAITIPSPLGPVLRTLADATVMGVTLSQAVEQVRGLPAVASSPDFNVFVTEMVVCHQRGANVIQAFDALRTVLEARRKYRAQVQEHMGQHLMQSLVIAALGVSVMALYAFMSPEGLGPLLESSVGQLILAASLLGNLLVVRVTHLSMLRQARRV